MSAPESRRWRPVVAGLDFLVANAAFGLAYWLRYEAEIGGPITSFTDVPFVDYAPWGLMLSGIIVALLAIEGHYANRRRSSWIESLYSIAGGTLVAVAILIVILYGIRPTAQSRLMLPYAALTTISSLGILRALEGWQHRRALKEGRGALRTLIVGAGESGRAIMRNIVAMPELGYRVVGFLDDDDDKRTRTIGRFQPLGETGELSEILDAEDVDLVIVTLPWSARDVIERLIETCEELGVGVRIVPDLLQLSLNRVVTESFNGIPLIVVRAPALQAAGWSSRVKRAMDVFIALGLIVVGAPLWAVIATAIRLEGPGPILFHQPRVGRDGKQFTLLKFRSMVQGADARRASLRDHSEVDGPIFKMRRDPRTTRVGRVIRRLSLDELPQLWNVLIGDMSLVGPRPPMPSEVVEYQDWHRRRLDVAPGMTGLWQVSGRSKLTFDEMVMLDLFYAENWSLFLDLKILLRTVPTVLRGTGAY